MSGHTKGPWSRSGVRVKLRLPGGSSDSHEVFATVDGVQEAVAYALYSDRNGLHSETFANARLIAAAPDLLDACQRALRHAQNIGIDSDGSSYVNILRAAITKATGEPS